MSRAQDLRTLGHSISEPELKIPHESTTRGIAYFNSNPDLNEVGLHDDKDNNKRKKVNFSSQVIEHETFEKYTNYFSEYDRTRIHIRPPTTEAQIQSIKDE
eukprot:Pgem_evm1s294